MKLPQLLLPILLVSGCQSAPEIPPEVRARRELLWQAYQEKDSLYPDLRAEALKDPGDRSFLIVNLILLMIPDTGIGADAGGRIRARAEAELLVIGDPAIPYLINYFASRDPLVSEICSSVVARMGDAAERELRKALGSANPKIRQWCLTTLGRMKPPRGEDVVLEVLARDPEWKVRGTAAEALGQYRSFTLRAALEDALQDEDSYVRRSAARSLGRLGASRAVPALINYLEACVKDDRLEEGAVARDILGKLSGQSLGLDPAAWREWWGKKESS